MVGTLAGAIYAGLLGVAVPHTSTLALTALLVITIAPLSIAAAVNASFRAAPFSALLVLLIAGQPGEGPVGSALLRIGEVAAAFTSALDALRRDGLPARLSAADIEQVFAFEQLHRDFSDLDRWVREHARQARGRPRSD